jgi:hypothetical protein
MAQELNYDTLICESLLPMLPYGSLKDFRRHPKDESIAILLLLLLHLFLCKIKCRTN